LTALLFITGATGFVGRRLVDALVRANVTDVRLLVRDVPKFAAPFVTPATWQCVSGSLDTPAVWHDSLRGVQTVVHLASSSGKVSKAAHEQAIVRGTEELVAASRNAGVTRFLYVSSVAAGFADRRYYHYAEAKRQAEALVRASGLDTLIVRPTMVFGAGSPVLDGMRKLAKLPVPIVFGDGVPNVQPIHVDDLAALLVLALDESLPWGGATISAGGADVIPTEALLRRLRGGATSDTRFRHVPVDPLRALLALVEPVLLPLLPFTAGQLTSFVNRSDAGPPAPLLATLLARLSPPLRGLDAMLPSDESRAT